MSISRRTTVRLLLCKEKGEFQVNERMGTNRNKKRIKCCRCGKHIFFSKEDMYTEDRDTYVDCQSCNHANKLKKIK